MDPIYLRETGQLTEPFPGGIDLSPGEYLRASGSHAFRLELGAIEAAQRRTSATRANLERELGTGALLTPAEWTLALVALLVVGLALRMTFVFPGLIMLVALAALMALAVWMGGPFLMSANGEKATTAEVLAERRRRRSTHRTVKAFLETGQGLDAEGISRLPLSEGSRAYLCWHLGREARARLQQRHQNAEPLRPDPDAPVRRSLIEYEHGVRQELPALPPEEQEEARAILLEIQQELQRRQPVEAQSRLPEARAYVRSLKR